VGKPGRQVYNLAYLAAFVLVQAYFTYVQPSLAARVMNFSLGLLVLASQCAWLLFRRVDSIMRPITRGLGMVFGAYCGLSLLRMILILAGPPAEKSFLQSGTMETLLIIVYQMLFIVATYSLAMMVNRRLLGAVQTQEERFRSMVEFSSDWDYWIGPDGKLLYTTPSCEALTGHGPQEFMDDPELRNRIVHPEDQAALREHADHVSSTSEPQHLDIRIVTRTGGTRWLNHMCRPVYDSKGRWLGRVASNRDVTERKEMERQLLDARKEWERIFNAVGHFTLILSPDQRILAVNQMGEKLIGRPASEMIGKQCYEVFHGNAAPPAGCPFSAMRRDGKITAAEMEVETLNRIYMVACTPVLDGAGHLDKVIHVATDITDRRLADKALRKSQERLLEAQRIARMGDFTWDVETGEVTWSGGLFDLLGYDRSETIDYARANEAIHHPDDLARVTRWLDDAIASGKEELPPNEYRVIRKDGGTLLIRTIGRIRRRQGQQPVIFATVQDITDIRKAEERIHESEETYRNLFQNAQVGLYRTRISDGKILESNEQLARMFGYDTREEFIAEYVTSQNYVDPGTRERMLDEIQKMGVIREFEVRFYRKDRSIFWARYSARIYPEKGRIEGVAEDITERKRAEEEREKLHAQLLQAQKMESVGRLAGGVAHDFNNKLSVIIGYTQLAMDDLDREHPLYGTLQQVLKAGNQSVDIVRQLLAFARKQAIAPEVLDLNEVIEGMLKMLRRLIGEDIDLAWEPGRHLWSVKMDMSQIDQILANLCVNARDAIAGVGKITIETENMVLDANYCADRAGFVPGDYVMLAVSDNGCGMDKETLANAFEPFFTTKEVGKGTGLGLSTVYGIVKQNNGFVSIYSEPDKGTTVKVYLPRHSKETEEKTEAAEAEMAHGHGETILVVEDETSVLQLSERILEKLGYRVLTAGTPAAAIDTARNHEGDIHLLMTDVVLPEMSGKDLAAEIMQICPNIRVLFMSGYTADFIAHQGVLDGGVAFIGKPFRFEKLAGKVREALGTRNAEVGTRS